MCLELVFRTLAVIFVSDFFFLVTNSVLLNLFACWILLADSFQRPIA